MTWKDSFNDSLEDFFYDSFNNFFDYLCQVLAPVELIFVQMYSDGTKGRLASTHLLGFPSKTLAAQMFQNLT